MSMQTEKRPIGGTPIGATLPGFIPGTPTQYEPDERPLTSRVILTTGYTGKKDTGAGGTDFSSRAVMHEATASLTTQVQHGASGPISGASRARWVLPGNLSKADQGIAAGLQELLECRSMDEHHKAFALLSNDVTWDTPGVLLSGRDAMRVMVYAAKRLLNLDMDVLAAKSEEAVNAPGRRTLTLDVTVHVMPVRPPWWLLPPLAFVLPHDVPVRATLEVGVVHTGADMGDAPGSISWIRTRMHNLPALPSLPRTAAGLLARALAASEDAWSAALPVLVGDRSVEGRRRGVGPGAARPY